MCDECNSLPTQTSLRTIVLDYRNDPRWDAFVSSQPGALIYHHSNWLTALEEEYGQKCVGLACVDQDGKICALLPLFPTRGLPFAIGRHSTERRLSSLPRTPVAGLLADGPAAASEVIRAAMEMVRDQRLQLEIKAQIDRIWQVMVDGLALPVSWRPSYIEELPSPSEGESWKDFCEKLASASHVVVLAKDAADCALAMPSSNIGSIGQ
jgi:hypothetical protein